MMGVRVSVLVPARNEEQVLSATVSSILASDLKGFEVIVIDDCSSDRTIEIVREAGVKLVCLKQAAGKPAALNEGVKLAEGDIIVVLDADSRPERKCLGRLVKPIIEEQCDATTGVIHSRGKNLIARLVSLEFNLAFGVFESFSSRIGLNSFLHGTNFALKKELAKFSEGALTEDFELTIKILSGGGRIGFVKDAVITEQAPHTIQVLIKQRLRWLCGIYDTAWRYREFVFKPKNIPQWSYRLIQYSFPYFLAFLALLFPFAPFYALAGIAVDLVFSALIQHRTKQPLSEIIYLPLLSLFYLSVILPLTVVSFFLKIFRKLPKWEKTQRVED